jgi:hypothetical protein
METLTHWKKLTNPNYIGSYSLEPGKDKTVTILKVVKEIVKNMEGKNEECVVAYLKDEKPMILNKTNMKAITKLLDTPYIEKWSNVSIVIFATKVKAFGEQVEALRIRPTLPGKSKPELDPKHEKWQGALSSLKDGNTTIEAIQKVYTISEENKQILIDLLSETV